MVWHLVTDFVSFGKVAWSWYSGSTLSPTLMAGLSFINYNELNCVQHKNEEKEGIHNKEKSPRISLGFIECKLDSQILYKCGFA